MAESSKIGLPDDPISQILRSCVLLAKTGKAMGHAIEVTQNATTQSHIARDSVNVILVIGESYIKSHCQSYGYPLPTSPQLQRLKDEGSLTIFNDVVAPDNSTSTTIKNMLCCNSIGEGESWYDSPFFPAIFNEAGYDVYFWDNQHDCAPKAEYSFALNSFIYNRGIERFYTATNRESFEFDEDIVTSFKNDVHRKKAANLVIFHLMGQHLDAAERFPHEEQYIRFHKEDVKRDEDYINEEARQRIADYDNATFYNDHVMAEIIELFKDVESVMVYLSDHGEEVYDFRDHYGRDHSPVISPSCAKYQFGIPFMIWCSDCYSEKHPEVVQRIKDSANKPFMSDNLCQVLFYLGGIQTPFYFEDRNILSPKYRCAPRIIGERADYDKLMERVQ